MSRTLSSLVGLRPRSIQIPTRRLILRSELHGPLELHDGFRKPPLRGEHPAEDDPHLRMAGIRGDGLREHLARFVHVTGCGQRRAELSQRDDVACPTRRYEAEVSQRLDRAVLLEQDVAHAFMSRLVVRGLLEDLRELDGGVIQPPLSQVGASEHLARRDDVGMSGIAPYELLQLHNACLQIAVHKVLGA